MFENPNYEWFLEWKEPETVCFESWYYMRLYNRIFKEGTPKDRYELQKELKGAKNAISGGSGFFGLIMGIIDPCDEYKRAVTTFIYNRVMAHYKDEDKRKRQIQNVANKERIRQMTIAIKGYDPNERAVSDLQYEKELEKNHTEKQITEVVLPNSIYLAKPPLIMAMGQKRIKKGQVTEQIVSNNPAKLFNDFIIHYEIYDKIWNYYTGVIWLEAENEPMPEPYMKDGKVVKLLIHSKRYATENGISIMVEKAIKNIKLNYHNESKQANKKSTVISNKNRSPRPKKQKSVDISKIEKALGMTESEDLNTDIF